MSCEAPVKSCDLNDSFDEFERRVVQFAPERMVYLPVQHRFTPGLYSREIFMPAGTVVTSKVHKTEHQFILSKGRIAVVDVEGRRFPIQAPHHGITKPGTRRFIHVLEDAVFTTFHATHETDLEKIEAELIEGRTGHLGLTEGELRDLKAFQNVLNTPAETHFRNQAIKNVEGGL